MKCYLAGSPHRHPLLSKAVNSHRRRGTYDLAALLCTAVSKTHYKIYSFMCIRIRLTITFIFTGGTWKYLEKTKRTGTGVFLFTFEGWRVSSSLRTGADAACVCCWGSPGLWPWRQCRRTGPEPSQLHGSLCPEDCLQIPEEHIQNTQADFRLYLQSYHKSYGNKFKSN